MSNVGLNQRKNLSERELHFDLAQRYRTSQPSQDLDAPQDENDDEDAQSSPFDSASHMSLKQMELANARASSNK